jgi:hypothetical protein
MKFLLDIAKMKTIELERQNKLILQKTNDVLLEWKNDYVKVIDVLKEKEKNLQVCHQEIELKKIKIFNLEDKLVSISILEKKIKYLKEEFDRDTKKLINNYEIRLKEVGDPYKMAPNLVNYHHEKMSDLKKVEVKNNEVQRDMIKTINRQQEKEKSLELKMKKLHLSSESKAVEILKLKEKMTAQNKEYFNSLSKKGDFFTRRALSFSAKNDGTGNLSSARSKNIQVVFLHLFIVITNMKKSNIFITMS